MATHKYKQGPSGSEVVTLVAFDDHKESTDSRASFSEIGLARNCSKQLVGNHVAALVKLGLMRKARGAKHCCFELTSAGEDCADSYRQKLRISNKKVTSKTKQAA